MSTGTTPAKVNRALAKAGLDVEIVRDPSGYYWFADETTAIRSLYRFNLHHDTTEEIVDYVRKELKRIADDRLFE